MMIRSATPRVAKLAVSECMSWVSSDSELCARKRGYVWLRTVHINASGAINLDVSEKRNSKTMRGCVRVWLVCGENRGWKQSPPCTLLAFEERAIKPFLLQTSAVYHKPNDTASQVHHANHAICKKET